MYLMAEELFLLSQPKPMELPIATIVGGDVTLQSLKQEHSTLLESIKIQRENYGEFCEDEQELNDTLGPIEKDPEPYSNGTIKTRPILKKYAMSLCEKLDLELNIEVAEEALRDVGLTPQEVKADMKRYITICEKKIASQQELCEQLQEQVKQLTDVVKCIVTHPIFDTDYDKDKHNGNTAGQSGLRTPKSLLTHATLNKNYYAQDFVIQCGGKIDGLIEGKYKSSSIVYASAINDIKSIDKFFQIEGNINEECWIDIKEHPNHPKVSTIRGVDYYISTPMTIACGKGSLEMVKFLHEKGATIGDTKYHVPNGPEGDLVAGYLQTHGSKPVIRF